VVGHLGLKLLEIGLVEWFNGWSTCFASMNHQFKSLLHQNIFLRKHSKKLKIFARKRMTH
jgi:hypothetical protein